LVGVPVVGFPEAANETTRWDRQCPWETPRFVRATRGRSIAGYAMISRVRARRWIPDWVGREIEEDEAPVVLGTSYKTHPSTASVWAA